MPVIFDTPEKLKDAVGQELGTSDWLEIDQKRIDLFAEATGDHQWIHVDPEKAKDGPFGTTIAHGYLTQSLVNFFMPQIFEVRSVKMGINYGANKLRFPAPVPVGSKVRGKGELIEASDTKDGAVQAIVRVSVEIEGSDRPACVIDTISRFYPA
jgi:acyl dehydratase